MPAPTFISAVEIDVIGGGATPGAKSIDVPSDAEVVVFFTREAVPSSMSSDFAGTFDFTTGGDGYSTNFGVAEVTTTGTGRTITPVWTFSAGEGPLFMVSFWKDCAGTDIATLFRDWAVDGQAGSDPTSATVDTDSEDVVIAWNVNFGFGMPPSSISGFTSAQITAEGFERNGLRGRLSYDTTPATPTQTVTGTDPDFASILVLSMMGASGGGATVETRNTSLALAIQAARSAAASVALPVQARGQQSASLALAVRASGAAQASLAAAVVQARAATALVGLAVRESRADSASLALAVQAADVATADLALAVQRVQNATTSVDLQVQAASQVSASIRALVQAGQSASVALEVLVQQARAVSSDLAAAVMVARAADADVSAAVQRTEAADLGVRLAIEFTRTGSLGVDLQVQDGFSHALSVSTAVQFLDDASASLSAAVSRLAGASASMAAAVSVRRFIDAEVDVVVQAMRQGAAGLSAFVVVAGQLMRWDATASTWVPAELKRFNGADWVDAELKRRDGADWV